MNVLQESDIRLAQWVAEIMAADKVEPEMLTPELIAAYLAEVGRRIEKIQAIYLTRTGAREAMGHTVYHLLKEEK